MSQILLRERLEISSLGIHVPRIAIEALQSVLACGLLRVAVRAHARFRHPRRFPNEVLRLRLGRLERLISRRIMKNRHVAVVEYLVKLGIRKALTLRVGPDSLAVLCECLLVSPFRARF